MSVFGIVATAENGDVPEPLIYPVRVVAPVPPRLTAMVVAFQVPVAIVPSVVMLAWPTYPLSMSTLSAFTKILPAVPITSSVEPVLVKPAPAPAPDPAPENCVQVILLVPITPPWSEVQ